MDLIRRRDLMGTKAEPEELYPVGTEILSTYLGTRSDGKIAMTNQHRINKDTGEYEAYTYQSARDVYIPIKSSYTYRKGSRGIPWVSFYDNSKKYLSYTTATAESGAMNIPIPRSAKFMRITGTTNSNLWNYSITRTA